MEAQVLARGVRSFIDRKSEPSVALRELFSHVLSRCPDTVIFGGMLREFALGRAEAFASDIDLVTYSSAHDLYLAIKHFNPVRNKFGGYRFLLGVQAFDIWAYEDTWAFREGFVRAGSFRDLLKTTFFNLDALAFDLRTKECWLSPNYINVVSQRVLEMNLEQNPFPKSMALKAMTLAVDKDLALGPRLSMFVLSQISHCDLNWFGRRFLEGLRKHVDQLPSSPYRFGAQYGDSE